MKPDFGQIRQGRKKNIYVLFPETSLISFRVGRYLGSKNFLDFFLHRKSMEIIQNSQKIEEKLPAVPKKQGR